MWQLQLFCWVEKISATFIAQNSNFGPREQNGRGHFEMFLTFSHFDVGLLGLIHSRDQEEDLYKVANFYHDLQVMSLHCDWTNMFIGYTLIVLSIKS
jgi:hypothetical protein